MKTNTFNLNQTEYTLGTGPLPHCARALFATLF
jgi:hypothetical protein